MGMMGVSEKGSDPNPLIISSFYHRRKRGNAVRCIDVLLTSVGTACYISPESQQKVKRSKDSLS